MVLSDVLAPIRRRWYILLIGLLLAGGVGWAVGALAPSQYTARGLVMLLPSALTTGPKGNPLLNMGGLELPARVLTAYYASEPAQSNLEALAPKATVQVSMEESTRGPVIAIDVKDATPDGAMRVLRYVADSIPENLARIQSEVGTPKRAAIGSMPLVLDTQAERDNSLAVRLVVASVTAALALTLFVLFLIDGALLRRTDIGVEVDTVGDGASHQNPHPAPTVASSSSSERMSDATPVPPGADGDGPSSDDSELGATLDCSDDILPQDRRDSDEARPLPKDDAADNGETVREVNGELQGEFGTPATRLSSTSPSA